MKKFKKKEIIALAVIAVLIIATLVVGGVAIVDTVNKANDKIENTNPTVTQTVGDTVASEDFTAQVESAKPVETTTEEATEKENNNDENITTTEASSASKNTTATTSSTTKPSKNNSKNNNNKKPTTSNNSNNNSNKNDTIDQIIPETKPVDKQEDVLAINGTKCNVGNTITVTIDMKTPKVLENFQGFTEYDSNYLEFVSVQGNVNGLFNNKDSVIYYNGSDINRGYNFTEKGTLYTVTFKVKKAGTTEIKNTIQVMSDQKSNPVDPADCDITIGIFN